jgi:hypothetical protein
MPAKEWDAQLDFQEGTFTNTEATADGRLVLSDGQVQGSWLSPIYEALDWQWWSQLFVIGTRPEGTNIFYRFKSGATSAACDQADFSPYDDDMRDDGRIDRSIRTYYLNNPGASVGKYFQIELHLEAS